LSIGRQSMETAKAFDAEKISIVASATNEVVRFMSKPSSRANPARASQYSRGSADIQRKKRLSRATNRRLWLATIQPLVPAAARPAHEVDALQVCPRE
jgi:hypothetical protein